MTRSLQPGVGAGAGLGTVGGGASAAASNRNKDVTDAAFLQLETATKRLSDLSALSARLFFPSPTVAAGIGNKYFADSVNGDSVSYMSAKESKVVVEIKLLCIKEQTEHYKYMLASDVYDGEEKKKAKKGLENIMVQLKELSK